jgi:hypothetical protein
VPGLLPSWFLHLTRQIVTALSHSASSAAPQSPRLCVWPVAVPAVALQLGPSALVAHPWPPPGTSLSQFTLGSAGVCSRPLLCCRKAISLSLWNFLTILHNSSLSSALPTTPCWTHWLVSQKHSVSPPLLTDRSCLDPTAASTAPSRTLLGW